MMYLDLCELPTLFTNRWLWSAYSTNLACFRRRDHLGDPTVSLDRCVRDRVQNETGRRISGPIRLLTHLSYFGYCFNPVSFYYCFDDAGDQVVTIVAEVNNTPWGEQHVYVLDETQNQIEARGAFQGKKSFHLDKALHVSPFMGMDQDYQWLFVCPGHHLSVHMVNIERERPIFEASLALNRIEISGSALTRVLVQYPIMTARVVAAIHWQAVRLFLKRCPWYPHPKWQNTQRLDYS